MKIGQQPLVEWNGATIHDIREPETDIPAGSTLHHVRDGDMLDYLAYKYYGDESLWYIIADANAIMDVMVPLTPGTQIVIPKL